MPYEVIRTDTIIVAILVLLMRRETQVNYPRPTWCKELTHLKRPWCWERLKAGGEGDDRGWDGCMASLTRWTWVWVRSRSWWWTGRPGVLQSMGLQTVRHDWATELNWTELNWRAILTILTSSNFNFDILMSDISNFMHVSFKPQNMVIFISRRGQFSCSVMSDSLWPHETQHARPPCPSPTPGVYPNPCALSCWCHPTISSSVVPFSSCSQSFPASGSFEMSQLFASGGQSIGVSSSTSVLPMNTQDWSPLGWTGWISLQPKGLSRVFSNTTVQKQKSINGQMN